MPLSYCNDEKLCLFIKESHQVIVSGLRSVWPNLQYQSEETDIPLIAAKPVPTYNKEVHSLAKRDEAVPISMIKY